MGISTRTGIARCMPSECQISPANALRPFVRNQADDFCYALGTTGPCSSGTSLRYFGYDVFLRRGRCADVNSSASPYFASGSEDAFLDSVFNQLLPEYDDFRVILTDRRPGASRRNATRRQETLTAGLFQLPAFYLTDPLLNPCRPGARNGNNYKCTNPLLYVPNCCITRIELNDTKTFSLISEWETRGDGYFKPSVPPLNAQPTAFCKQQACAARTQRVPTVARPISTSRTPDSAVSESSKHRNHVTLSGLIMQRLR